MADFNIDISDSSIEVLSLKKSLFGKIGVSSFGRSELEEGIVKNGEILNIHQLGEKLKELVKKGRTNFTLPDLRVFTHRLQLPLDISRSAMWSFLKEKVVEVIPYNFEALVYDFKIVNETEKGREILLVAIPKKILIDYLRAFQILKITPSFAVPESIAAFEIFRETVLKDEVVLYVDIGSQTSTLSFFDKFGPFLTLNEPVATRVLKKEIEKANAFIKEKYNKESKRVILGGGGSLEIDGEAFSREIEIWTTKTDKILEDKLRKIPLAFNVGKFPPVLFLNVLGLSLLAQRKEELNLLKERKSLIEELVKQEAACRRVEEKEKEVKGEGKEGERWKGEKREREEEEGEKVRQSGEERKGSKRFLIMVIILASAFISFLVIYFLISSRKNLLTRKPLAKKPSEQMGQDASTSSSPAASIPTPTIKMSRKELKVKILNGSGFSGRAKEVASFLEGLGYQVVGTGNADSFDYDETVIKIKEKKGDFFFLLTNDLKTHYTVSMEKRLLSEEEEAEVVIIVGKK